MLPLETEMEMVFPFLFWRFSGTINSPHLALANAGVEATRDGHGPDSNLAAATERESSHPAIANPRAIADSVQGANIRQPVMSCHLSTDS